MFTKREIEMHFDIIIGENATINGDMKSEGSIRIDGQINGNVSSKGNVIVSDSANINGDIDCLNTEIYGSCKGNVSVKGKINLHENAVLIGDVMAKAFSTKEGAHFSGQCHVNESESSNLIPLSSKEKDLTNDHFEQEAHNVTQKKVK